jgi:hypothetical protein
MDETAAWYARVAGEVDGLYAEWAAGVAGDAAVVALISELPRGKRQPQLVFAVSRLLGAPEASYEGWRAWVVEHWAAVASEAEQRMTQTNEPQRCAVLLPALALIPGPIALLEVGASAGLCLYPDRYSYRYRSATVTGTRPDSTDGQVSASIDPIRLDPADGPSAVVLDCAVTGEAPLPTALPDIVWRVGIDLAPLSVATERDLRWLDVSVPPEASERGQRARDAAAIVRREPPTLIAGDATAKLSALAATAPAGATLVILTAGTLVYLPRAAREAFAAEVARVGAHWLSFEAAGMVALSGEQHPGTFVLGLDGTALATASPHGETLAWHQ